jgi:hypothetical protein
MPRDSSDLPADRVVEVYAAANVFEAHELQAVLAEEGIQSQIVGEELGNAAGCLPLGEALAPRIWVREADASRAREIIDQCIGQPHEEGAEPLDGDDQDASEEEAETPGAGYYWLGQALMGLGMICIVAGLVWGSVNWVTLHTHQGTAQGVLVGGKDKTSYIPATSDRNVPGAGQRSGFFSFDYELEYQFTASGKNYYAVVENGNVDDRQVPIHYDLEDPGQNVVGPLTRPWTILLWTCGIGAFLILGGRTCCRKAASLGPADRS